MGAAHLRGVEAEAGVVRRDRPVRAEHHVGAHRSDLTRRHRVGALVHAETLGPRVGHVGVDPAQVDRLHRGIHAFPREAGLRLRGRCLDVLDAVATGRAPGCGVRVEHLAHSTVADRVRRDVEAGVMEARDGTSVVLDVGPHRVAAVTVRIGLFHPRCAGVDDAVQHELQRVRGPAPTAELAPRRDVVERVGVVRRVDPVVLPYPHREQTRVFQRSEGLERLATAVHVVDAGDTDRVLLGDDLGVPLHELGGARLRLVAPDRLDRRHLAQLTRGAAVTVDDDEGSIGELTRPGDAGDAQRLRVHKTGVHVEGEDEHRAVAGRLVDERVVVVDAAECGVLEGESAHPSAGADPLAFGAQESAHLVEVLHPVEIDAATEHRTHEQVLMAVDEARRHVPPRAGDHLGGGIARGTNLGIVADRHDHAVLDRDRGRRRTLWIKGAHRHTDESEICRHGSSWETKYGATVTGRQRFCQGY